MARRFTKASKFKIATKAAEKAGYSDFSKGSPGAMERKKIAEAIAKDQGKKKAKKKRKAKRK